MPKLASQTPYEGTACKHSCRFFVMHTCCMRRSVARSNRGSVCLCLADPVNSDLASRRIGAASGEQARQVKAVETQA